GFPARWLPAPGMVARPPESGRYGGRLAGRDECSSS
ncbi:hypothetical protein A2U01_0053676, partial [Trifolium medium]|nr:hypothetical protein [Trifolium medium]